MLCCWLAGWLAGRRALFSCPSGRPVSRFLFICFFFSYCCCFFSCLVIFSFFCCCFCFKLSGVLAPFFFVYPRVHCRWHRMAKITLLCLPQCASLTYIIRLLPFIFVFIFILVLFVFLLLICFCFCFCLFRILSSNVFLLLTYVCCACRTQY